MAKKRGFTSPLGNIPGSKEATNESRKSDLISIINKLKVESSQSEIPLDDLLAEHLGVSSVGQSKKWVLNSGKEATFTPVTLTFEQLKENTVVTFDINGREQSLLTLDSLDDLTTLDNQQFYPAIGRRLSDGKIDILDGSRRRAYTLLKQGEIPSFSMLITDDEITEIDAKALAKSLQTAKEHNLREVGLRLKRDIQAQLNESNVKPTQLELAQRHQLSQSKVSKALQAAEVDDCLIKAFPDVSLLTHSDYKKLLGTQTLLGDQLESFMQSVMDNVLTLRAGGELSKEDLKEKLIELIAKETKQFKTPSEKAIVTPIVKFDNKDQFARKKVKGRTFSYEFSRIPKSTQDKIEEAIKRILEEDSQ